MGLRPGIRFEVFKRDKFTCAYCGRRSPDAVLEVDHVLAKANGGADEIDNLVTSCDECNRGKAARPLGQVAPALDPKARAARIAEHERQIAAYSKWRAAQRQREDEELQALREAFGRIPSAVFTAGSEQRWCWKDATARTFLRKLGYYEVLDAVEIVAGHHFTNQYGDEQRAYDVWRYFCGCCWRLIKEPERFA